MNFGRDDHFITDRSIVLRCSDCERETGRSSRVGSLFLIADGSEQIGVLPVARGMGSSKSQRPDGDRVELVADRTKVRYWCSRCERRNGRVAYKVVPVDWFLELFAEMGEEQKTRILTV